MARGWLLLLAVSWGCGGDDDLYASCDQPADCEVPDDATAECLEKGDAGFCTWACDVDDDCVLEEDDFPRVCASFESEAGKSCFPSCDDGETTADGEPTCPEGTGCRSTGGGSDNRKVCFPNDTTTSPT